MFTTELQLVRKGFLKKLLLCKISSIYNSRKNNRTDKPCMHSQLKGLSSEILPEGSVSFGRQGAPVDSASTGAFLNFPAALSSFAGRQKRCSRTGQFPPLFLGSLAWRPPARLSLANSVPQPPCQVSLSRKTENAVLKLEKTTSQ